MRLHSGCCRGLRAGSLCLSVRRFLLFRFTVDAVLTALLINVIGKRNAEDVFVLENFLPFLRYVGQLPFFLRSEIENKDKEIKKEMYTMNTHTPYIYVNKYQKNINARLGGTCPQCPPPSFGPATGPCSQPSSLEEGGRGAQKNLTTKKGMFSDLPLQLLENARLHALIYSQTLYIFVNKCVS